MISGPLTFFGAEVITGQMIVAGVLAVVSAVLAAWLSSRPGLIRERAASRQSEEEQHARFLLEELRFRTRQVVLVRTSKHNAVNYIDVCHKWMWDAQKLLGDKAPPHTFLFHDDLCGDEDRGMLELIKPGEVGRSGEIHMTGRGE